MRSILLIVAFVFSGMSFAQETTSTTSSADMSESDDNSMPEEPGTTTSESGVTMCTGGGEERKIEIVYETPGSKIPCRVDYTKSSGTTTLWQATNEEGYCEAKVQGLIEKLTTSGFECK